MKTGWDTKELKADPVPLQQHSDPSVQKGAHPRTDGWPSQKAEEPLSLLSFQILFCQHCSDLWGSQFNVDSFVREKVIFRLPPSSKFRNFRGVWGTATAKGHAWTWGGEVKRMTQ